MNDGFVATPSASLPTRIGASAKNRLGHEEKDAAAPTLWTSRTRLRLHTDAPRTTGGDNWARKVDSFAMLGACRVLSRSKER
jgi:hypothetical protein